MGATSEGKKCLLGMTTAELKSAVASLGMQPFVGTQIASWLYGHNVTEIDQMTNLSKANRTLLSAHYTVGAMPHVVCQQSVDGTKKYLFPVRCSDYDSGQSLEAGKRFVETVYIPDGERATLCVSSQVGCKMNCLFCQTGKQGFHGNLSATDIINQIYSLSEREKLTNVVFMGQGEPMDNLDAVLKATGLLTSNDIFAWSPKRITVSSVGIKGKLKRFLDESPCHIAISMHSPLHSQRQQIMPAERAMSIEDTVALLRQYDFTHQRRCSFEYICFSGLNDTIAHGKEIVRLLRGLECRVNLIRFHRIPDADLPSSDDVRMQQLRDYLTNHGVFTTIRASRGQDIMAACGLLSTANENENKN